MGRRKLKIEQEEKKEKIKEKKITNKLLRGVKQ